MNRLKIKDAVEFIIRYRRDKVYRGFSYREIVEDVVDAIRHNAFGWIMDRQGQIVGIVSGEPDPARRVLHIRHFLAIAPVLKEFAALYRQHYPGWTITGTRRGKATTYNTNRFMQLLENYYGRR